MPSLYEPAELAGLRLHNRFFRSATHEGCGTPSGDVDPTLGDIYRKLAKGGTGAIITGYAGISPAGRTLANMPLFDTPERASAYAALSAEARTAGTPVIVQLAHGGAQANARPAGTDMLAPSPFKFFLGNARARAMTEKEIETTIDDFIRAAVLAREAGLDGVQLHCAHGYLLSQFLSPKINRRTDRWGGSLENRFRIIGAILDGIRKTAGSFPVLAKLSAYSLDKKNITLEDAVRTARLLEDYGCDAVEISCGSGTDGLSTCRPVRAPVEAFLELTEEMRTANAVKRVVSRLVLPLAIRCPRPVTDYNIEAARRIKQEVSIPVLVTGGLRSREMMEKVIAENSADFVALSRPFIIEPGLVTRFRDREQPESRCINCSYCLIGCLEHRLRCYYGKIPVQR